MIYNVIILKETFKIEANQPKIAGEKGLKLWLKNNKPKYNSIKVIVRLSPDFHGRTYSKFYEFKLTLIKK